MSLPTSSALQSLLTLLREKYLYATDDFDGRCRLISLLAKDHCDTVILETPPDIPFLILTASEGALTRQIPAALTKAALATETVGLIGTFDARTNELEIYKRRFRDNGFDAINALEHNFRRPLAKRSSSACAKSRIQAAELENLFFEIHSAMRDIDGLHADAALEELCKLIYLKSYSEEHKSAQDLRGAYGSTEEFAAYLRAAYRDAVNYDLRVFGLRIPEYKRSRGVFDEPIYLTSTALARSYEILSVVTLALLDTDVKGRAFQKVLGKSVRAGMGQYFTPSEVCELMVGIIQPRSSELILDPFCGSGHFLSLALDHVQHSSKRGKEFHEFAFGKLHGIEKSERMTRIAMTDMRLNGDGHSNIRCTDALLAFDNYPDLHPESFDIVLTNPPFGSLLSAEALAGLPSYTLARGRRRVPLEMLGLERAIEFLRPGGRIGIVLPESIFSASSTTYVRDWLIQHISIRIVIDLPTTTFSPFGANVRSGILFGRKFRRGETPNPSSSILMLKSEDIGYDASGRPTGSSDVENCVKRAVDFLTEKDW